MLNRNVPILIVEDSDEDYEVLTLTFEARGISNPLMRLIDGDQVISSLEARRQRHELLPGLILLDLNLIGRDGREVLQQLKAHAVLSSIPVIVRSTSSNPKDISFCMATGASAYCVKPVALTDLEHFAEALKMFWMDCASLPTITN